MRRFRPTLVAGAVALAVAAGAASAQFTNAYVFGDSLSDAGQYGARFTTNPGLDVPDVRRPALRPHDRRRRSPGRHRLRAGRRARQLAVAADSAERAEHLDRAAGRRSSSRSGPARSQRALPDPGRRQRHLHARRRRSAAGRSRRRSCRPASRRPRRPRRAGRARCRPRARSTSSCYNLPDVGQDARGRRAGAAARRSPRSPACSTRR